MTTVDDEIQIVGHERASGSTPAEEEAHEHAQQMDTQIEAAGVPEAEPRQPRFARMRFNWNSPEEVQAIHAAHAAVEGVVVREFYDAYQIMADIQSIVREQETDGKGNLMTEGGLPKWKRTPTGRIEEDYTKMTRKQQEAFLGQITTRLFAWEQSAEKMWAEAMMAKAAYEERFAITYDRLRGTAGRTTVDDRNQHASMESADERYFAIYMTSVSRRAQALTRSMERISQRIKDIIVSS